MNAGGAGALGMWIGVAALGAAVMSLSACASMETVSFQSRPAGAAVSLSTGPGCGATPCAISVPRRDDSVAPFSKSGLADAAVPVTAAYGDRGKTLLVLNTIAGGAGGALGTEMSGAGYEHAPNPVVATLRRGDRTRAGGAGRRTQPAEARPGT